MVAFNNKRCTGLIATSKRRATEVEVVCLYLIHRLVSHDLQYHKRVVSLIYCLALQAQEGGSADLLGLGVPSAGGTNGAVNGAASVTNNIAKFHCKSNGVLYENEILQVVL